MSRRLAFLSVLVAGTALSSGASAAVAPGGAAPAAVPVRQVGVQLAQLKEAEVYYDGRGNRVIVDPDTGEVIAVEPMRRLTPRGERRFLRDRYLGRADPYEDEDYAARMRERRAYLRRLDRQDEADSPRDPDQPYVQRDYGADDYPDTPDEAYPEEQQQPPARKAPRKPARQQEEVTSAEPDTVTVPKVVTGDQGAERPPITAAGRDDVAAVQVLLDRAGASPGVIDGKFGSNVDKAFAAYREITGSSLKSTDTAGIKAALAASGGDAFTTYTITAEDAAGPFVASIPADYGQKAKLERLGYTSVTEMLAERFHMDEGYLKALNPEANFSRPGTIVRVVNLGQDVATPVKRIVANKGLKEVFAYDAAGKLVAAYPATIGSADTPSPTGTHMVSRVALNPNYTYNPDLNFKQGDNDRILTIPPGPNGPVGSVWIALDKPTYGIHGTPDPEKIGKTESHGCVRLTNWDAQELAKLVSPGVVVQFID